MADKQENPGLVFKSPESIKRLRSFVWVAHGFLFSLIASLATWHIFSDINQINDLVYREASIRLTTADHIRKWIVGFGGVYAKVTEEHQPNPYIPEIAGREIETKDGGKLTIANSISALNEIMGQDNRIVGAFIRFTAHNPLKESNHPDAWETLALERLSNGEKLVSGYTDYEDKPYFRMMQPLTLTPKCFKCHSYPNTYKLGDVIGGLDINVDLSVYSDLKDYTVSHHILSYAIVWLVGGIAISFGGRKWKKFLLERDSFSHKLQELAIHDPLTGFLNRHQSDLIFSNEIARAKRNSASFSVCLIDVDKFKDINDTYGHLAGDKVLKGLSSLYTPEIRDSDYLIRYGGDEFMFVLTETSHEESLLKAKEICGLAAKHLIEISSDKSVSVTLSIGVASYPQHGDTQKTLFEAADDRLYEAKAKGRNQVC